MATFFHADDFGLSISQSKRILSCCAAYTGEKTGALNSTSAMVNSPVFTATAALAHPLVKKGTLKIGLHINVVEGHCCTDPASIPLLVNKGGVFKLSFAQMLAVSAGSKRKELYNELIQEVSAQLDLFLSVFPLQRHTLRLDSHQHFHMIPTVFDAVLAATTSRDCTLEYLRIPAEPIMPYLKTPALYNAYPPVNWIKSALLNSLWVRNKKHYPAHLKHPAAFFGIILSGCMERTLEANLLDKFKTVAKNRGTDLEVLFHPGGLDTLDQCPNTQLEGFTAFHLSPHRAREAQALRTILPPTT